MTISDIHAQLVKAFGQKIIELHTTSVDPWIEVASDSILEIARYLKSDRELLLDSLTNLTGVDYLETDPKKKFPYTPHLEVVYHLYSFERKHRVTLKAKLPRWKGDQPGALPEIDSVSSVWAIADWHEREAYDLVGIQFRGHPNLLRILCPDDWEGHPLRKDYEFPLEYHEIRGR